MTQQMAQLMSPGHVLGLDKRGPDNGIVEIENKADNLGDVSGSAWSAVSHSRREYC